MPAGSAGALPLPLPVPHPLAGPPSRCRRPLQLPAPAGQLAGLLAQSPALSPTRLTASPRLAACAPPSAEFTHTRYLRCVSRYRLYLESKYGDDAEVQDFIAEQLHEFGDDGGSDIEANGLAERAAAEEQGEGEGEGDEQHEAEWAEEAGQGSDSRDEPQGSSSGE
jgi:hypothetical protein